MYALSRTIRPQGKLHMATKNPAFEEAHQGHEARRAAPSRREPRSQLTLHQACVGPTMPGRAREYYALPAGSWAISGEFCL